MKKLLTSLATIVMLTTPCYNLLGWGYPRHHRRGRRIGYFFGDTIRDIATTAIIADQLKKASSPDVDLLRKNIEYNNDLIRKLLQSLRDAEKRFNSEMDDLEDEMKDKINKQEDAIDKLKKRIKSLESKTK